MLRPGARHAEAAVLQQRGEALFLREVLKRRRLEIMPTYNVTMNNGLVRHHGLGGQVNFYMSESLFIGVEGTYYAKQILDRYYLIGVDHRYAQ